MKGTDKQVGVLLILALLIHISAILFGVLFSSAARLSAAANVFFGCLLLLYWVKKQLSIQQHIFELREFWVLGAEVVLVVISVYSLIHPNAVIVRYIQFGGFGIHLLVVIGFILLMVTFKIKRLF